MEESRLLVQVKEQMTLAEKKRAIEMAVFFGFETESTTFPVAFREKGILVPDTLEALRCYKSPTGGMDIPEDYISATRHAKPVEEFDWRRQKGLESMFSIGSLLQDENHDMLPDAFAFKIILPEDCDCATVIGACNIAFRYGMETTAYQGPIVAEEGYEGPFIRFEVSEHCSMTWSQEGKNKGVIIAGSGSDLEEFTALICERFPLLSEGQTWESALQEMTDSFAMKNPDGQLTYTQCYIEKGEEASAYVSPELLENQSGMELFPNISFKSYKGNKKVYEHTYEIPWEVDVFKEKMKEQVYPKLQQGDSVSVYGALSEEKSIRETVQKEVEDSIKQYGASVNEVQLLCAYKQGISWIEEIVLPEIRLALADTDKKVGKIQIGFRPYLAKGITDWGDVDGATPSYNNTSSDGDQHFMDLPIRFLQELYPVEDILIKELGIENEQIVFEINEEPGTFTYRLQAFSKDEDAIWQGQYEVRVAERPYLDAFPGLGKVHPPTGYMKVCVNKVVVMEERIRTDMEQIWDIYQAEVLRDCGQYVAQKTKGNPSPRLQPFFSQLRLEITASEPDFSFASREDLCSSLDAMHEDLYFAGADYFKNFGLQYTGEILDAPGLILPVIKKGQGKPSFKVVLYEQEQTEPCIVRQNQIIKAKVGRADVSVYLKEIRYENGHVIAQVGTAGIDENLANSYTTLLAQGALEQNKVLSGIGALEICTEKGITSAPLSIVKEQQTPLDIRDIDLLEHTVIGYEEYRNIIEQLKRVPGISVYRTAVSYMGRDIYAIELLSGEKGYTSRTKRITKYPSEIINARHHANEVSGTNSAFILLKTILLDTHYREITKRLNLVMVPMENVDGAAIHYELQKDNPKWKLHVARFNAIGKEFYHEHFKSKTIHTEAMSFTRLWRKFLPDVVVDNHGVPSHEWEQPFSGYTAPSFKGFWLPRSLLYGYFWHVTDEEFKGNYKINKEMENVIADAIGENEEMTSHNRAWMHQFEKFAHCWMPKLFPANYYKDMINYWIAFQYDKAHRYPSIRFPWITTVAYTSEVADETAQGAYLNLCARTHVTQDLAAIDMLGRCHCVYEEEELFTQDAISRKHIRQRPIIVLADAKQQL